MAHECPDCYGVCYCHGDIDDMLMGDTEEERGCSHCPMDRDDDDDCDENSESSNEDEYPDCLGCGTCDGCVEQSIAYAEEMARD